MSTIDRPDACILPPLVTGERLDQPTFHARYEAMPPETRAELIDGVVHMPSPLRGDHGKSSFGVAGWLCHYQRFTRGIEGADNVTTILGSFGEPQPDCILRIPEERGGLSHVNEEGYITGPPELVVEVARSSRTIDLGPKKDDYRRAGVPEYVVIEIDPDRVHWFILDAGEYHEHRPGPDGVYRCQRFPGLWFDAAAFFAGDYETLFATLDRGLATPEHAAFVARLAGGGQPAP